MTTTDINTSTAIDSARAALCSFLQSYGTSWTTRPEVIDLRESPVMTESLLIHFFFPILEQYGPSLTERLAEHIHDIARSVKPMVAPNDPVAFIHFASKVNNLAIAIQCDLAQASSKGKEDCGQSDCQPKELLRSDLPREPSHPRAGVSRDRLASQYRHHGCRRKQGSSS